MCDENQAEFDNYLYPTVESLPKYDNPVKSNGYWGAFKLAANGAVYSQHVRCGRLVQLNHACEWCYDKKRFPLFNLVNFIQNNQQWTGDTPQTRAKFARDIDEEIRKFCNAH